MGDEPQQLRGSGRLRHGVAHVPVSDIARVYFCELKLHYSYTLGEAASPEAEAGTAPCGCPLSTGGGGRYRRMSDGVSCAR